MTTKNYTQVALDILNKECLGLDKELANLYALLVFAKGFNTTLEDVHNAWALWRNNSDPTHRSLIAFGMLTKEVQDLDTKYMEAIHTTRRKLESG